MHIYRMEILQNIPPLYCNMIPCLFQLNFALLLPANIFSLLLFLAFCFLRPVKDSEFVDDHQT